MNLESSVFLHATAILDEGAKVGAGTKIWHWVHVSSGAQIGERCVLGQNVYVGARAILGNNVRVQNNVSIYDEVYLEDDVFCGPSMVFTNVFNPRAVVSRKDEYRKTIVKRGATLGANCTILCGLTIGEFAFIGAGSVVTQNIPAHGLFYGNPAKWRGWMSESAEKLEKSEKAGQWICPRTRSLYEELTSGLRRIS